MCLHHRERQVNAVWENNLLTANCENYMKEIHRVGKTQSFLMLQVTHIVIIGH
jgi:hypothetical protein